ncbi:MAG: EthD family reductase [Gemmatimonadota bacterium]
MRSATVTVIAALLIIAGCGKRADQAAGKPDSAMQAPAALAGPQAIVTVICRWPKDTAAFERYCPTHLELVGDAQQEIGFTKAEPTKFPSSLDGKRPEVYRQAELYFDSLGDAKKRMATPAFQKIADDFRNFLAPDGLIGLVAVETGDRSSVPCPDLATVIYDTPADTTAFEASYPEHLRLVSSVQAAIGFRRADLTRFISNLDGTPPARYRQAELCFDSLEALQARLATPGFKKVGDDYANSVTNGLTGMIGVESR